MKILKADPRSNLTECNHLYGTFIFLPRKYAVFKTIIGK